MHKNGKYKFKNIQHAQVFYEWFPLLENKKLNVTDIVVLAVINNLCNMTGACTANNDYLVKVLHMSLATIKRSIKKLRDNGIIECVNSKGMSGTNKRSIVVVSEKIYDIAKLINEKEQDQEKHEQGSKTNCLGLKNENSDEENDIYSLDNSHLKENKRKEKENKKEKGLQSNPMHPADALSSNSFDEEEYSKNESSEEAIPITYDDEVLSKICNWIDANEAEKNILNKKLKTIDLLLRKIIIEEEIDNRSVDYNLLKVIYHIADKHKTYVRDGFKGLFLFNTINKHLNDQEIRNYVQTKETQYFKINGYPTNDPTKLTSKNIKVLKDITVDYVNDNPVQKQLDEIGSREEKEDYIKSSCKGIAKTYIEILDKSEELYNQIYEIIEETMIKEISLGSTELISVISI